MNTKRESEVILSNTEQSELYLPKTQDHPFVYSNESFYDSECLGEILESNFDSSY
ncbi:hypothetical protein LEP1GSC050_0481 [Leptospira broomii serovar Hurstbridge str. 5399]|uniref:Uncharacterized protein n=1 Tax=Leptospira broomii serovar Hurstbridge str. 5399 TaxID=1049789 RepID=T0GM62_9LEPT|nr:hypothetical protein [Leptospira broomii]EQA46453.1 hypothetical protein LEP1GSC050_0481 [Leptospira broomii serovar Hurstbridge str. 5399]